MDLDSLNQKILKCNACGLRKQCNQVLVGEGSFDCKIMFIGEAPGVNEDKTGRHFIGASGKVLDELLSSINLSRENIYITNIVKCRPPHNRDPYPQEINECKKWLGWQIKLINPEVIVPLGRFAMRKFFPDLYVSKEHGTIRISRNRHYFIMFHPAVALYDSSNKKILLEDFQKLGKFLKENNLN